MADSKSRMPANPSDWGLGVQQLLDFASKTVFKTDGEKFAEKFAGFSEDIPEMSSNGKVIMEIIFMGLIDMIESGTDPENTINLYTLNTDIVKPMTKGHGVGLANFLNMDAPKTATVFVSHAWAERFALLVVSLCLGCVPIEDEAQDGCSRKWLGGLLSQNIKNLLEPSAVLWICALAINQNQDIHGALGGDLMQSPFAIVLRQCSEVRVVYNRNINLYSRVWCCLEMYLCQQRADEDPSFHIYAAGLPEKKAIEDLLAECGVGGTHSRTHQEGVQKLLDDDAKLNSEPRDKVEVYAEYFTNTVVKDFLAKPGQRIDICNAKASVEQDRMDIMDKIADRVEKVNDTVNDAYAKVLGHRLASNYWYSHV